MKRIIMASIVSLSLCGPALASQWWMPVREQEKWICKDAAPLTPDNWYKFLNDNDFHPFMVNKEAGIMVAWREHGTDTSLVFMRTLDGCQFVALQRK